MSELVLVKLGGGVITDKNKAYTLRRKVLERLAKEIAEGYSGGGFELIVGHGAGSYGHWSAKKYRTAEGFINSESKMGMVRVRHDAVRLNQIVTESLIKAGLPAFSFSPSSMVSVENGELKSVFVASMIDLLRKNMVPVIHGDVMVDEQKGCGIFSTERVFEIIVRALRDKYQKIRIVHVSSEDGVLVDDRVIDGITRANFAEIKTVLGGSRGVDVTGGMLHKVEQSLDLADEGIESVIISGLVKGRLFRTVLERKITGTRIHSSEKK